MSETNPWAIAPEQGSRLEFWGRPSDGAFRTITAPKVPVVTTTLFESDDTFPNDGTVSGNYAVWRNIDDFNRSVERVLRALMPVAADFDALYCTGLSGTMPTAVAAYHMRKPLLVLRKLYKGDTQSHGMLLEGDCQYTASCRFMIVDDFISTGRTLHRLLHYMPMNGKLAGLLLYGQPRTKYETENGGINYRRWKGIGDDGTYTDWRAVRRGEESMIFDLIELHPCSQPSS